MIKVIASYQIKRMRGLHHIVFFFFNSTTKKWTWCWRWFMQAYRGCRIKWAANKLILSNWIRRCSD